MTYTWSIPTGKTISGSTFIKDTDNHLADTMDDLVNFVNGEGTHVGQGLTYDMVDKASAQTISGAKTFTDVVNTAGITVDGIGAGTGSITINDNNIQFYNANGDDGKFDYSDIADEMKYYFPVNTFTGSVSASGGFTGDLEGNATGLTGMTSTIAELNKLDGYTGSVTELNWLDTLHATGVTATEFDYLDGVTSNIQTQINAIATTSGTYTPTLANVANAASFSHNGVAMYKRIGSIVEVSGSLSLQCINDSSQITITISLPVASTFASTYDASGIASANLPTSVSGTIVGGSSVTKAYLSVYLGTTSSRTLKYTFTYRVL